MNVILNGEATRAMSHGEASVWTNQFIACETSFSQRRYRQGSEIVPVVGMGEGDYHTEDLQSREIYHEIRKNASEKIRCLFGMKMFSTKRNSYHDKYEEDLTTLFRIMKVIYLERLSSYWNGLLWPLLLT